MHRILTIVAAVLAAMPALAAAAPALRVAVVEFQNGGGGGPEADALGKGLQSMVTTDLAQVGAFQLIERSRLRDIQAELNLGRSGLVDPKTAARIGKLLGAHIVAGTFTISGGKMRLDTRLFSVDDGRILLAEASEGERDAFFELEKDLVKKVIRGAGVTLPPKERAEVARIHTADFKAFQKFSEGVSLFDEKKYDGAVAALRDAERRDGNFRLAAVTLAEYERIVTELRSKADSITRSEQEVRVLAQNRAVADFVAMIGKLEAIATRPGAAAQLERMAALVALADYYDEPKSSDNGSHNLLWEVRDNFEMQRAADAARRRYFAEWVEAFPRLHVRLGIFRRHIGWLHPATFAQDWKQYLASFARERPGDQSDWEQRSAFGSMELDAVARRLVMDRREEIKLRQTVLRHYGSLHPPEDWRRSEELELARNLRAVGDTAESTAVFARLAVGEKDARRLRDLADEIEQNRKLEAARAVPVREPTAEDAYRLSSTRRLPPWEERQIFQRQMFLGQSPAWGVRGDQRDVTTGAREDELVARELRYAPWYEGDDGALVMLDGVPRRDVAVEMTISYEPPGDWWPPSHAPRSRDYPRPTASVRPRIDRRPDVAFAFGVRDIDAKSRPLKSLQLVIAPSAVRLVETVESGDQYHRQTAVHVLAEKAVDLAGERQVGLSVRVSGATVTATVNGRAYEFAVPSVQAGFYGVAFRGAGYAAVGAWKTATPH